MQSDRTRGARVNIRKVGPFTSKFRLTRLLWRVQSVPIVRHGKPRDRADCLFFVVALTSTHTHDGMVGMIGNSVILQLADNWREIFVFETNACFRKLGVCV